MCPFSKKLVTFRTLVGYDVIDVAVQNRQRSLSVVVLNGLFFGVCLWWSLTGYDYRLRYRWIRQNS